MENEQTRLVVETLRNFDKAFHFNSESEESIFLAMEALHEYLFDVEGSWHWMTRLASLYKKKYKKITPQVREFALRAIHREEHTDAVVYFCSAVINNSKIDEARKDLMEFSVRHLRRPEHILFMQIFYAILDWKSGDYSSYVSKIKSFFNEKPFSFRPYLLTPLSSVWVDEIRPTEVLSQNEVPFPELATIRTIQPNFVPEYIISVSCDSRYYNLYQKFFLDSLVRLKDNFYCHISVVDHVDSVPIDPRISIQSQHLMCPENKGPVSLALRYIHAYDFAEAFNCPVVVLDFDCAVQKGLNRPGFRGGWLVLIMQLLNIPADRVRIVPQTLPVGYDRWVQGDVLG
jgi:hypothetical protein